MREAWKHPRLGRVSNIISEALNTWHDKASIPKDWPGNFYYAEQIIALLCPDYERTDSHE